MRTQSEADLNRQRSAGFQRLVVDIGEPEELIFFGDTVGHVSSNVDTHTHPVGSRPPEGQRCSACRWIDISLYRFQYLVNPPAPWVDRYDLLPNMFGEYGGNFIPPPDDAPVWFLMIGVGETLIPDEVTKYTINITPSAFELIELGTLYNRTSGKSYIPVPTARVFAQAADKDEKIKDAYVNRAVV